MKALKFIFSGMLFGIIMIKSEAASWYRIQEMFRFQSFHMYGIISTAVLIGVLSILIIKKLKINDISGNKIVFPIKERGWRRYLLGGIIFGLGWALTGACPGPMFVTLGYGYLMMATVILSALAGTFCYGLLKDKLPH
jgi:uncharacterized membrane protein YedE/YeeE